MHLEYKGLIAKLESMAMYQGFYAKTSICISIKFLYQVLDIFACMMHNSLENKSYMADIN